ncbi:BQ2448_647 [Microbotryum intermedium]|uniref:BQ2448_647 protein n=1 Tax=Microbotryum intermedium TaxID=269621 RepID=A0A238FBS9_9BASI|nr:BQ2448_647 [Microbotryum intermedium]
MAPSSSSAGSSPPRLPDVALARRRSQSRTSSGSFRSSLGGKPIGPKYGAASSSALRRSDSGTTSASSVGVLSPNLPSFDSSGAPSPLANASDISIGDAALRFGSFSATREELRDARLASLSLSQPSPNLATVSAPQPSLPLGSPTYSPFSEAQNRDRDRDRDRDRSHRATGVEPINAPAGPSHSSPSSSKNDHLKSSPSNLALARPSTLFQSQSNTSSDGAVGSPSSSLAVSGGMDGSPNSGGTDEITPTQSKVGTPSMGLGRSLSVKAGPSSGEATPRPLGTLGAEQAKEEATAARLAKARRREEKKQFKLQILGDETGGTDSEDSDDDDNALAEGEQSSGSDESPGHSRPGTLNGPTNEQTPLLGRGRQPSHATNKPDSVKAEDGILATVSSALSHRAHSVVHRVRSVKVTQDDLKQGVRDSVTALPAVILGVLMNILDGVSYGLIMFPTNLPRFANFGGIGVSMFFVSCVISQLVYSSGGSIFKGGNGSMMIEVVPFFHSIVGIIYKHLSDDKDVVATTMVAFALSSILTGFAFAMLGFLRLGRLSEFFPRHILVGCIGGVGAFLFITGLQVSARLEDSKGLSIELLQQYLDLKNLPLWVIPLVLAVVLRLITARYQHPLIFPGYFLAIPLVFYVISLSARIPIANLRENGWVFELNGVDSEWYEFWTLFGLTIWALCFPDFQKTDWSALVETIPTQLALVFFGLLHVPINVPALGISVGEDNVDTDRELVAHGISNVVAGLFGTVPNYLCYVNSVLFYKVGGTTRISGFLLAGASTGVLLAGPGVIGYLPVCVVGALIFILGIDLVKEAVWDTYGRVSRLEYLTIWVIVFVMTVWDFVAGIGAGIILASVSFVVSSSQRRAIRSILTGAVARSTVRRHPKQSAFLKDVGRQTRVIKLQGFLFFGTISSCETTIRKILEAAEWSKNPIRFLILDFSMASGVDFSAAEAFVRIQRLLDDKDVLLALCGCALDSSVGIALRSVDLWVEGPESKVEVFENLNDALEFCENAYLRSLYSNNFEQPHRTTSSSGPPVLTSQIDMPKSELDSAIEDFGRSPRASHLRYAAKEAMAKSDAPAPRSNLKQPLPLLMQSLKPFAADLNEDYCFRLTPYFKRIHVQRGTVLWEQDADSDSFYLIESGILRANYVFVDRAHAIVESMVAGTIAGEMSFLSRSRRNATVTAERDSVLWKLDIASHEKMGQEQGWAFTRKLEACLLRIAVEEQDVLMVRLVVAP